VDYLTKPFDPWVLRAKVSVFVELWSKTRQLEAQAEAHRQLKVLLGAVDEAVAVLRTGGEPREALELLERARP
jgi:DNA-binding response OmpR family regulator